MCRISGARGVGKLGAEEDDEAGDRVAIDGEEVADGDVAPAPDEVDLDGQAVPVDDERSRRGSHVGALEEGVAVEAADRLTRVVYRGGLDGRGARVLASPPGGARRRSGI
jgi:hypothetical protein